MNDKNIDTKKEKKKPIQPENEFLEYLDSIKFEKHLKKLAEKLKNKKIIIYGAGAFFQSIKEHYDLSQLNIIAISDRKFANHIEGETFWDYLVCAPDEIKKINPDYVLVSMRWFVSIIDQLYCETLAGTKIKIKPLIKKPVKELLKEIWNM